MAPPVGGETASKMTPSFFRPERLLCALLLLSAAQAQQATSADPLTLDKSVSVKVSGEDSKGGKVEQTRDGVRITYSNEKENRPTLQIVKTFDPPREASELDFEIEGDCSADGGHQVHVRDTENCAAMKPLSNSNSGMFVMDLGAAFDGAKQPFSGKVKSILISIWLDGGSGEHTLEVKNFKLQ